MLVLFPPVVHCILMSYLLFSYLYLLIPFTYLASFPIPLPTVSHWFFLCICKTMRITQKIKIKLPTGTRHSWLYISDLYLKKTKKLIQEDISTPMIIVALFAIVKIWRKYNFHDICFLGCCIEYFSKTMQNNYFILFTLVH